VLHCDAPAALLGQMNVVITCEVKARPEVTALYWISDVESGTTIVASDSDGDLWTSNMVSLSALIDLMVSCDTRTSYLIQKMPKQ